MRRVRRTAGRASPAPCADGNQTCPPSTSRVAMATASPLALACDATTSEATPVRRNAAAVASPTAATDAPSSAAASITPMTSRTAVALVNATQRGGDRPASAAVAATIPAGSAIGSVARRGTTTTSAPSEWRASTIPAARSRARVTSTRRPASGCLTRANAPGGDRGGRDLQDLLLVPPAEPWPRRPGLR